MILNDSWVVNLKKPAKRYRIRKRRTLSSVGPTMRFRRYEPLSVPLTVGIDPGPGSLKYEDIEFRAKSLANSMRGPQMEYNLRKAKQFEELVKLKDVGFPMPPLRELLRPALPYEFNKIKRMKPKMFNEDEIKFIGETAVRDLNSVNIKVEDLVNQMAKLGKNLSDLKTVQSRLISIVQAIKEEDEEEEDCQRRCC